MPQQHNPFYYNQPVVPVDFVGRWPLVDAILNNLSSPRSDSWAIIGGRRFGKSSVLKAIEQRLYELLAQAEPGDWFIFPLIVDLKGCETHSEKSIYACIIRTLERTLRRHATFKLPLENTLLQTTMASHPQTLTFYQFEDILDDLTRSVESSCGSFRLVLLLDEVEKAIHFEWVETLFDNLRALVYDGPLANTIKLVLTGSTKVVGAKQSGSPLLNAVKIEHLAALQPADIQQLIERGSYPEEVGDTVQQLCGGHPFIAQYLLHYLWADDRVTDPHYVEQIVRRMRQERLNDFLGWWEAVGDSGQQSYRILVTADDWLHEQALIRANHHSNQPLEQGLTALCYHGIARRDDSRQRYQIAGTLFRDWYLQIERETVTLLTAPDLNHIKRLVSIHQKRLAKLEEQKAYKGSETETHILLEIDQIKTQIDILQAQLNQPEQETHTT